MSNASLTHHSTVRNVHPTPGMSKLPQWLPLQSLNNNNSQQPPQPQYQNGQSNNALANYTLPGIISYLTNEFTNLERFKIMSNLEKSEMKYRITQLQGELNAVKYINEQQKLKIQSLQQENAKLRLNNPDEQAVDPDISLPESDSNLEIPDIDLDLIKDSRYQLTKSMKEVIHLLKSPINTNIDYLDLPNVNETTNSFDELMSNDNFVFNGYNRNSQENQKSGISKFFDDSGYKNEVGDTSINDKFNSMSIDDQVDHSASNGVRTEESDSETVVLDGSNDLNSDKEDGEIEPDIDDLELSSQLQIKSSVYDFESSELNQSKVFKNVNDDMAVVLNYSDNKNNLIINLFDIKSNTVIVSAKGSQTLMVDLTEIIDLCVLEFDKEDQSVRLLVIYSSGKVNQVVFNEEDSIQLSLLELDVGNSKVESSALIEFDHKQQPRHKSFGLAMAIADDAIRVFELTIGPRDSITQTSLGAFDKEFFKLISGSPEDRFEVIKWFKTTNSKKIKPANSQVDTSLQSFEIIVRMGDAIFSLNLVLKDISPITDLSSSFKSDLEGNNTGIIINNNVDGVSQLEIYDLSKQRINDPNIITIDSSSSSFTILNKREPYIIEVNSLELKLYDMSYKLLESTSIPEYTNIYRFGNSIGFSNNHNLHIYYI